MGIEVNTNTGNCFNYSKNSMVGMKVAFMAKNGYKLGIEQEVNPLTIQIEISKPVTPHGIQIITLVNADNQMSYRHDLEISKEKLEELYDNYIADNEYDIVDAIFGKK